MIRNAETFEGVGYYPSTLKLKSSKLIVAMCELCGKMRILKRKDYHTFCNSCSRILSGKTKGKHFTKDHKAKISEALKGENNGMFGKNGNDHPFFGKSHTNESKVLIRASLKGNKNHFGCENTEESKALMRAKKKGKNHPNYGKRGKDANGYKDGNKISKARSHAKRQRDLGYTLLLLLKDGEVGHHFTNEYVIGIPAEVHVSFGGRREKHRALVLEWLKDNDIQKYNLVFDILAKEPLK